MADHLWMCSVKLCVMELGPLSPFLGNFMYKHNRGVIKESAVKAILQDPLFSQKVEKPKKGKGSYRRVKAVKAYL